MIPNSYIYKFSWIVKSNDFPNINLDFRNLLVKIWDKFCLFKADTKDFLDSQIKSVYNKSQIYINIRWNKISLDFSNDYRKLKRNWFYFEIDKENLFLKSEKKIKKILKKVLKKDCLDVWCGDSFYKEIFINNKVNYFWIDVHKIDNWFNIQEITFEDYDSDKKFDTILFFRSINHFKDTKMVFEKALNYLKKDWKIFIVENELFWEIKLKSQVFEWKKGDFEHFFNYTLADFKKVVNTNNLRILYEEEVNENIANQWYICLQKKI